MGNTSLGVWKVIDRE